MKKYTIVPTSQFQDKSGLSQKQQAELLSSIILLNDKGISVALPTGKEVIKRGVVYKIVSNISISPVHKIIKLENGKFALLGKFQKNNKKSKKTIKSIVPVEQKYFTEFLMPLFMSIEKYIQEGELDHLFSKLYFSDKKYAKLRDKWLKAREEKNIAAKGQQYENAAKARDEEKGVEKEIQKYLLPKVSKFAKKNPDVITEGWIRFATEGRYL